MAVMEISKENFKTEVLEAKGFVLVDFWASWCVPCKMLAPVIDDVASELTHVKVVKVNVDNEQQLAADYDVMNIPTLIVFRDGKEVNRSMGFVPKQSIMALFNE